MSEKNGRSEEKTDFWGNKYTQHYDENGNKTGTSEDVESLFFSDRYTQHYDTNGNKTGTSEDKETLFFGDRYTQHYDNDENKTGTSEDKETLIFGDRYAQHYDTNGNKTGTSEDKETLIFGDKYTQHYKDISSNQKEGIAQSSSSSDQRNSYSYGYSTNSTSELGKEVSQNTSWIFSAAIIVVIALAFGEFGNKKYNHSQVPVMSGSAPASIDNVFAAAVEKCGQDSSGCWKANVDKYLKAGASPSSKRASGSSVLELAIAVGEYEIAKRLIDRGADVNSIGTHGGQIALHTLISKTRYGLDDSSMDLLEILFANGVDLNKKEKPGITALMVAASSPDRPLVVKMLLGHGADPTVKIPEAGNIAVSYGFHGGEDALAIAKRTRDEMARQPLIKTWPEAAEHRENYLSAASETIALLEDALKTSR